MKYIKTYEGLFDFFKKVDLKKSKDKNIDECSDFLLNGLRRILSSKSGLKEKKITDGFEWSFSDSMDGHDLIYIIKISQRIQNLFYLHIQCENEDISDHIEIYFKQERKKQFIILSNNYIMGLEDLELKINSSIKMLSNRINFIKNFPKEDIVDYCQDIIDLVNLNNLNYKLELKKSKVTYWILTIYLEVSLSNIDVDFKDNLKLDLKNLRKVLHSNGLNFKYKRVSLGSGLLSTDNKVPTNDSEIYILYIYDMNEKINSEL